MRFDTRERKSAGKGNQSAVMPSELVTARNDTTEQLRGIEHAITETARTMIASGRYNGADIARAMGVTRQALNERVRRANGR